VTAGDDGAWQGFDAAGARARAGGDLARLPTEGRLPRAALVLATRARGLGDPALGLWRGGRLGGRRRQAGGGGRAAAGAAAGGTPGGRSRVAAATSTTSPRW